ncbi:MAG: cupin domain-containing protein [Bacteroidota bacterium]|nr:cupin domain-containing protein [Bacteroidota bacterium]
MKAIHNKYNKAESLKLFEGLTVKVLLSASETGGLQAVFEDIVEPGVGPGRHIHHKQDETFLFIEGTFDVEIDGQLYKMSAGDTAFVPKGTVHAWKNVGDGIGRLRYIFSPALNIEEMFRDISNANIDQGISEEFMKKLASDYPEQETVGPPL